MRAATQLTRASRPFSLNQTGTLYAAIWHILSLPLTEERIAREDFYKNMVWVVNVRGKRDLKEFRNRVRPLWDNILYEGSCALMREWNASPVPVYFDLGVRPEDGMPDFWRRDPISRNGTVFLTPVQRESFLKMHREGHNGLLEEALLSKHIGGFVERLRRAATQKWFPPPGFQNIARRTRRF